MSTFTGQRKLFRSEDTAPSSCWSRTVTVKFSFLPTHSLPARSTSCSLVRNTAWELLGRGEGHGEGDGEGEGQGEETALAKSSSDDWFKEAGLARLQRGLHHSLGVELRRMSLLALCSLRAEGEAGIKQVETSGGGGVGGVLPSASALGLLEETVRVTMRWERDESLWMRVGQWARSFSTAPNTCITSAASRTGLREHTHTPE